MRLEEWIWEITLKNNVCRGADEGWLVTFDRAPERSWEERLTWEDVVREGKTIHLVGA